VRRTPRPREGSSCGYGRPASPVGQFCRVGSMFTSCVAFDLQASEGEPILYMSRLTPDERRALTEAVLDINLDPDELVRALDRRVVSRRPEKGTRADKVASDVAWIDELELEGADPIRRWLEQALFQSAGFKRRSTFESVWRRLYPSEDVPCEPLLGRPGEKLDRANEVAGNRWWSRWPRWWKIGFPIAATTVAAVMKFVPNIVESPSLDVCIRDQVEQQLRQRGSTALEDTTTALLEAFDRPISIEASSALFDMVLDPAWLEGVEACATQHGKPPPKMSVSATVRVATNGSPRGGLRVVNDADPGESCVTDSNAGVCSIALHDLRARNYSFKLVAEGYRPSHTVVSAARLSDGVDIRAESDTPPDPNPSSVPTGKPPVSPLPCDPFTNPDCPG
jgi:hypothetical protein